MNEEYMEQEEYEAQYTPQTSNSSERTPYNELDMQFMVTQPAWGREYTPELNKKLRELKDGEQLDEETEQYLWGLLAYYTRDLRLGNLSNFGGEVEYCRYWLDLAGDLLRDGLPKSFLTAISRVITVIELSQSKGGFLRRRQGTVTSESVKSEIPATQKKMFGGRKELP